MIQFVNVPGYWMNETSGVLRPAVEAFLRGGPMTAEQVAAMRAYLRQWIAGDWGTGSTLDALRESVHDINSRAAIDRWIEVATDFGADPL